MPNFFDPDNQLLIFPHVQAIPGTKPERPPVPTRRQQAIQNGHSQPTELDHDILTYVMEYYLVTAWQLVNLHYSKGSKTRASTKLQILASQHPTIPSPSYLFRDTLSTKTPGNPTLLYWLATDGIKYLRRNGYPQLMRRFRPSETQELSYPHTIHALNVNDVLIAARNLPKVLPDIRLAAWLHDFDLQKTPAFVPVERKTALCMLLTVTVSLRPCYALWQWV